MQYAACSSSRRVHVLTDILSFPDDEYTTQYSLKQFGVCDLEPDYMDCPFAK